jgi:hypothetical protein
MARKRGASASRKRASAGSKRGKARAAVARVGRVTREVVQQAQGAVVAGMETLKDLGETLVERVRPQEPQQT